MELLEYIQIVKKRLWLIIAITAAAMIASGVVSFFIMKPVYQAKATLIIGRTPANTSDKVQYNDILMYQNLVKTYSELIKSNSVAQEAVSKAGYDMTYSQLQASLSVTPKAGTQIIEIAVQDKSPERAYNLTNTVAKVFEGSVKVMMNTDDVKILDEATLPKSPVKPRKMLNIIIAGFVGLMASLGIVFLMEYLDNTIKTEQDIEKYLGITVLASIPFVKEGESK